MEHVVLAYAGDRAGSIALGWLASRPGTRVVTLTLDIGQGGALEDVRERALSLGALRAHVVDARDEFARDFLWPALAAGAMRASVTLGHALVAPLLARHLTELADIERATAVAHAGSSRDAIDRIARSVRGLCAVDVVPALRESGMADCDQRAFTAGMGVPSAWMADGTDLVCNLWERAVVMPTTLDDDTFRRTRTPAEAPDDGAAIDIAFEQGYPAAVNGVTLSNADLIATLDTIAGVHGVGRFTPAARHLMYEAPAAFVLEAAHTALQRHVLPSDLDAVAVGVGETYSALITRGDWYGTTRHALDAFVDRVRELVTGEVRVTLFKGRCDVTAVSPRRAPAHAIAPAPAPLGKGA